MIFLLRCLFLFLACFITLTAGEMGVVVSASTPWTDPKGYTPVVITIQSPNDTAINLRTVSNKSSASVSLFARAGESIHYTLLLPPTTSGYLYTRSVDWDTRSGASGEAHISSHGSSRDVRGYIIDPTESFDLVGLNKYIKSSTTSDKFARLNAVTLPDRWQGYPTWLTLVLTEQGQAALNDSQLAAITTWASAGGTLAVISTTQSNYWLRRFIKTPVVGPGDKGHATLSQLHALHNNHDNWEPRIAPVVGTETVPVKTFVVLAIVFALVVGPLNMWWVRRRKARYLFLVTTPALSLATCLILIIASLMADGIDTKRGAVQLMLIDQSAQQSIRWTGCSYFASFASTQVQLDAQAKMLIFDSNNQHGYRYNNDDRNALHVTWQNGQRITGSIIPARVHRQLGYVEALPERRRVEIHRSKDGWRVSNGLGVSMSSFRWTDPQGAHWQCNAVPVGEQSDLALASVAMKEGVPKTIHAQELSKELNERIGREAWLAWDRIKTQPFCYVAVADQPLDPLPGPSAIDSDLPLIYVAGIAAPIGDAP